MMQVTFDRRARRAGTATCRARRLPTALCCTAAFVTFLAACTARPIPENDPAERPTDPGGLPPVADMTTPGTTTVDDSTPGTTATDTAATDASVPDTAPPPPLAAVAALDLSLCPIRVSNAPPDAGGRITRRSPLACLDGVEVHVAPAPGACLSSGFGPRSGRTHRGIDYHSRPAVDIVAAAAGVVRVAGFREKDFGHWVVIDHGGGVHTGYAHLAGLAEGIRVGETVGSGQRLGLMGDTGRASRAVHLHYEVRRGNFDNPKRWFGLEPIDPFTLPERCAPTN